MRITRIAEWKEAKTCRTCLKADVRHIHFRLTAGGAAVFITMKSGGLFLLIQVQRYSFGLQGPWPAHQLTVTLTDSGVLALPLTTPLNVALC